MPTKKDIDKLYKDIDKYRIDNNIDSMFEFGVCVDLTLPIPCFATNLVSSKSRFSKWRAGKENGGENMGDATYNLLRMFLDANLKTEK